MVKVVFMFDVPKEKREEYLKVTAEVIKPFWESHGCLSYSVWQTDEGSPDFIKEMFFEDLTSKEKTMTLSQVAPEAKEVVARWRSFTVNMQRKSCVQKV